MYIIIIIYEMGGTELKGCMKIEVAVPNSPYAVVK